MHRSFRAAFLAVLGTVLPSPLVLAQDVVAPGFERTVLPYPGGSSFSATAVLSGGDLVVFDGLSIDRYDAGGALVEHLASLGGFAYPSFVLPDADEVRLFLGESSTGAIYRCFLDLASDPVLLTTLPFNYDAAFAGDESLYVSAATCGFTCGNEIWRVDLASGATTLVARVPGASGPLLVDGAGGLVYGTVSNLFPAPIGSSSILRWSPTQLRRALAPAPSLGTVAHAWLGVEDAATLASGFTSAFRLARDPRSEELFLLENDFATGTNRVRAVRTSDADSPVLVEGAPFRSVANVSFLAAPHAARFRAFQPEQGGTLVYTTTDFGSFTERASLIPRRPQADVQGPGTLGPGTFTLSLVDGPPSGFALVAFGPSATVLAPESVLVVGGLPLFLGLAPATIGTLPGLVPLDAQGAFQEDLDNPGGLEGTLAFQLFLYGPGMELVGSSSLAFL